MPKVTVDLDDDLYQKLTEFSAAKGRPPPEELLQELLIAPVQHLFFEISAPRDYFQQPAPLTQEDAETALRERVQPILDSVRGAVRRPEALLT